MRRSNKARADLKQIAEQIKALLADDNTYPLEERKMVLKLKAELNEIITGIEVRIVAAGLSKLQTGNVEKEG